MSSDKKYSDRWIAIVESKFNGDFNAARKHMQEIGSRGGTTTYKKHGKAHMSKAGKAGWRGLVDKHFSGDECKAKTTIGHLGAGWFYYNRGLKLDVALNYLRMIRDVYPHLISETDDGSVEINMKKY